MAFVWFVRPRRCFIIKMLLLERAQLVERGQPILAVPSPYDLSVLEFVDVDGLDVHLTILGWKAHERCFLRARKLRAHDDLVSVPENFRRGDCEIGKALRQIIEDELDACSARRLTRCRWNVGPLLAHDLLGKCRISLVEGVIPNSDAGAGTGRETCKRMARKTATHSAIA